ncbi:MAG: YbjN domain-containing protein [Deltaproteobacteria bacterium]|nr:YbjN domain-containing protein [Deltaproteobacteria bacterium]
MTRHSGRPSTALALALASLAFLTLSSRPLTAEGDGIYRNITPAQLLAIMHDSLGFEAEDVSDEDGPKVRWDIMEGKKAFILIQNESQALMFYYGTSGTQATLQDVNRWNQGYRFSRAYLDKDGDPILELDLDMEGGVTEARIRDYLKTCKQSLNGFLSEVINKK